jgi:hypothetical protein
MENESNNLVTEIKEQKVEKTESYYECPLCQKICKPLNNPAPVCFECKEPLDKVTDTKEEIKKDYKFFCPICAEWINGSDYLAGLFEDKETVWLANLITHYRHSHIKYWDNSQKYIHSHGIDYDEEKQKVNERIKRNIIRKCSQFLKENSVKIKHFKNLKGTEEKTINLFKKRVMGK